MASMRRAAVLSFSASTLLFFACLPQPALSSPFLPPDRPAIDSPEIATRVAVNASMRVDIPGATGPVADNDAKTPMHVGPRRVLADFAMKLRNIAYRHGGSELSTGFDCSGFVRYVFQKSLGLDLPTNSTSQFEAGSHVDRDALKMGDLVFFRTQGRRVSHVGIYLDNGLFIHSPSHGKRVRIDHLDESYWAKRFAGARRPDALI
jgi:cell wall-associated NlpC family hydrolase